MKGSAKRYRFGVDVRRMYRRTGLGIVPYHLVRMLPKLDGQDAFQWFLYEKPAPTGGFKVFVQSLIKETFWKQLVLPIQLFLNRIDAFLSTTPIVPFLSPCPSVAFIYDLSFLRYRESLRQVPSVVDKFFLLVYRLSATRATRIITISVSSKKDIVEFLKVPSKKVEVVYLGVDRSYKRCSANLGLEVRRRYGIDREFLLAVVGRFIPRKNVPTLIASYAELPSSLRSIYDLVILGDRDHSSFLPIAQMIRRLAVDDRVKVVQHVNRSDLPAIYSSASILVHLCLHEGFGLPILESMACGTPVVASNTSSIPEVAGDSAVLVDPLNPQAVCKAIREVLVDCDLRNALVTKGVERAKHFSWEISVRKIVRILIEVAVGNGDNS